MELERGIQVHLVSLGERFNPLSSLGQGRWIDERVPQRHIMAERRSENLSLHLSQSRVQLYGCFCFLATREAILLLAS